MLPPVFFLVLLGALPAVKAEDSSIYTESASTLQGKIEKSNAATRLVRPASPVSTLPASEAKKPVLTGANVLQEVQSGDFKLEFEEEPGLKSQTGKIDWNLSGYVSARRPLFDLNAYRNELEASLHRPCNCLNARDLPLQEREGSRMILWDAWHRDFVENLYTHFHNANHGRYPGACRVLIFVSKDGDINFIGGADYQMQSDEFKQSLLRAVTRIAHSPFLRFPPGTRRSVVHFTMLLRSSGDGGRPSWGSQYGDVERIPSR